MGWFDQSAGMNQFNPEDDYATNQKRIQMQRALAQAMQQQLSPGGLAGGQNGGFYAGPKKAAVLANVLQNLMGAYAQNKAMEGEIANEKASRADYKAGRDLLFKDQAEYIDDAQKNAYAYTHKNPEQVGPQPEPVAPPPEAAQTFPVAPQGPIETRPLARAVAAASPASNPATRVGTEVGRPTSTGMAPAKALQAARAQLRNDPEAAALSVGEFNTRVQARANELMRPTATPQARPVAPQARPVAPQARPVAPQVTPAAPVATPVPTILPPPQAPQQAVQTPQAPVEQAPQGGSPFNVDVGAQQQYLARAVQADRQKALELLDRSGERGAGLSRAIEAQMLGPKKDEYTTLKPGESLYRNGKLVLTAGNGGDSLEERKFRYQQEQDALKNGNTDKARAAAALKLKSVTSEIDDVIARGDADSATGFSGKVGDAFTKWTGVATDAAGARSRIDALSNKAIGSMIQQMQAEGVSPSQLANTETEAKRLGSMIANLDYSRLSAADLTRELSKFRNGLVDLYNTTKGASASQGSNIGPSGVQW